jgi:2-polyprenyl-3-methyl-5-hydroxy-6-metoxy-1,4-benzoquinol methylase
MNTRPQTDQDHLDFYLEHQISPVRQDISDLGRHLERRESLYRNLGLPAMFIEGKGVLEVGPGSGHNSIHVAAAKPAILDLVEPNPTGARGVEDLYASLSIPHTPPRLICQRLEEFNAAAEYDVVIAEAWLGVPEHERELMARLAGFVRPGGILVTTLSSPIGMLANTLRRILGSVLVHAIPTLEEKSTQLLTAFGPHLDTLADMSRPHLDWVQDSLLNPGFLTSCLTPAPLFKALGDGYSLYNSYPRLVTDWRWYKSLYGVKRRFNEIYLESYFALCHNLFDHRSVLPARAPERNAELEESCFALMSRVAAYENEDARVPVAELTGLVEPIRDNIDEVSPVWSAAIEEFIIVLTEKGVEPGRIAAMAALGPVFGRELLYVSMIRDR